MSLCSLFGKERGSWVGRKLVRIDNGGGCMECPRRWRTLETGNKKNLAYKSEAFRLVDHLS